MPDQAPPPSITPVHNLYDLATGDEDARVCRDISEAQCRDQPVNFFLHLPALVANKAGDELASPKLTLPWLLGAIGAPAWMLGFLVPLREALALLPQLAVAGWMRRAPRRKWFWSAGAAVQALAVLAMAATALALEGTAGGLAILGALAVFALARGVCSVAYKDVQGKTIAKGRRGTLSGYAASAGGAIAVAFALWLLWAPSDRGTAGTVSVLLALAGAMWLAAALVFAALREEPGATEGGGSALREAWRSLDSLRRQPDFARFVAVRGLLTATALSAPFYAELTRTRSDGAEGLGLLLLAAGVAGLLGAPFWGRAADRSSRRVLIATGGGTVLLNLAVAALAAVGAGIAWFALAYFALAVLHAGVRLGRKTYLVDLADAGNRAGYTAVSNTAIGVLLLLGGGLVAAASAWGAAAVVLLLALPAALGAVLALRLPEVE